MNAVQDQFNQTNPRERDEFAALYYAHGHQSPPARYYVQNIYNHLNQAERAEYMQLHYSHGGYYPRLTPTPSANPVTACYRRFSPDQRAEFVALYNNDAVASWDI